MEAIQLKLKNELKLVCHVELLAGCLVALIETNFMSKNRAMRFVCVELIFFSGCQVAAAAALHVMHLLEGLNQSA